MKKKRVWLIVAALVLTIAAITVYNRKKAADSAATQAAVQEFTVTRGNITRTVEATGFIQPLEEVEIYSDVDGEVIRLDVVSGQKVKKGQVLALVDAKVELNQLERVRADYLEAKRQYLALLEGPSEAELAQLDANIKQAEANLESAKADYERMVRLEKEKIVSKQQLEQSQVKYLSAIESLKIAKAKKELELEKAQDWEITAAKARLESAKVNLEILEERAKDIKGREYALIAPIDGVILAVNIKVGAKKAFSGQTEIPLITMADLNDLKAEFDIDESEIHEIAIGQKVMVKPTASDRAFPAVVDMVRSKGEDSRGVMVYKVTANLQAGHDLLKPGMSVEASVLVEERKNVLCLPSQAVLQKKGRTLIMVKDKNGPRMQPVEVGIEDDEFIEIRSGLAEGERVLAPNRTGMGQNGQKQQRQDRERRGPTMLPGFRPPMGGGRRR